MVPPRTADLSFFERVAVVNHLRRLAGGGTAPHEALSSLASIPRDSDFWRKEDLLRPVIPGDALLQQLEAGDGDSDEEGPAPGAGADCGSGAGGALDSSGSKRGAAHESYSGEVLELRAEVEELRRRLAVARVSLHSLTADGGEAEAGGIASATTGSGESSGTADRAASGPAPAAASAPASAAPAASGFVADDEAAADEASYFDSYSHHGIHAEMLQDSARTEAYRACLESHSARVKDAAVLDVGCGTGILSMFAARGGARLVVGVDNSAMADAAREIVALNGLGDRVRVLKGRVEDVNMPEPKVWQAHPPADRHVVPRPRRAHGPLV